MTQTDLLIKEAPLAIKVQGESITQLPEDLYIPPEALRVFIEAFEGPLDLLLYLIKKQNIDILNIPIAKITHQYMTYIDLMKELQLELAAEYLLMAAMLAEIKSRLLLPHPSIEEEEGEDPRAELVRRLQEYERFKQAAEELDGLPRVERDIFVAETAAPPMNDVAVLPQVPLSSLLDALKAVMTRAHLFSNHQIQEELLSIRERMTRILSTVTTEKFTEFTELFTAQEGRMGVVVTLIAILELIRQSVLELVQSAPYAPIYVKSRGT